MSEKLILYYHILSPPCRAVLMCGAELGIEFDLKVVDLMGLEHKTEEYIEKNSQHTIPFLDDNGTLISDSHAICAYLVAKFGDSDRLYPKDLAKRALVDSRLHFDSGHLFCRLRMLYEPILYNQSKEMPEDRIKYIQSQWDIINRFVENSLFLCGDEVTIADLCLVATAESLLETAPLDPVDHSKVVDWMERMTQLPYYDELNAVPSHDLQAAVRAVLQKNQNS